MKRELEAVKITDNHDTVFKKKTQIRLLFHMKETQRKKENKQR